MVLESHGDVVSHVTLKRGRVGRTEAVELGGIIFLRKREDDDEGDDNMGKIITLRG